MIFSGPPPPRRTWKEKFGIQERCHLDRREEVSPRGVLAKMAPLTCCLRIPGAFPRARRAATARAAGAGAAAPPGKKARPAAPTQMRVTAAWDMSGEAPESDLALVHFVSRGFVIGVGPGQEGGRQLCPVTRWASNEMTQIWFFLRFSPVVFALPGDIFGHRNWQGMIGSMGIILGTKTEKGFLTEFAFYSQDE